MAIQKVMVVGAGQMGSGIAQVCAQAGYDVLLNDMNEDALSKGMSRIEGLLARAVEKERMTEEEKQATMGRLTASSTLNDAKDCDLVIEAVVENMDVKTSVFKQLDEIAPKHAILASNTSSLPITDICAATNRPDQVIGMHFMNNR